ncbi:unnamed protein product [Urochloa humidicola]
MHVSLSGFVRVGKHTPRNKITLFLQRVPHMKTPRSGRQRQVRRTAGRQQSPSATENSGVMCLSLEELQFQVRRITMSE